MPEVDEDRLRKAYSLLKDVVSELATGNEAVRDSEIKRQMLKREPKFDEAALGFRKFSRFLRQAHDEEVINLEQGAEGNYLVSPISGSERSTTTGVTETGQPEESRERPRGRNSRRGGRGRSRSDSKGSAEVSAPEEEPVAEAAPMVEEAGTSVEQAEAHPVEAEVTASEAEVAAPEPEAPVVEASPPVERPRLGLGRNRSGRGRVARPTAAAAAPPAPAPAPAPDTKDKKETEAKSEISEQTASPPKKERKPRTRPDRGTSTPSKAGVKYRAEIDHMSKEYPSVGRRTAERLFEEFGDDLLKVIDTQPERIKAILPEHRARAVIDGRRAERESNDSA